MVPRNVVAAMAANPPDMLQIIVFALLMGAAATMLPEDTRDRFLSFVGAFNEVVLKMVEIVMLLAPVGAGALIARAIVQSGIEILGTLAAYSFAVLAALLIHLVVVYSLSVRLLGGMSPLDFFRGMRDAMLTAFSTSSSGATLPVNIRCVTSNLGVSPQVASFVLPLGATVNMDGTAIMQAVAAVFITQVYGPELGLVDQLTILVTATLASIGTAPVPGAGIIMLGIIMIPIGAPLEGIALILGVDRFLDMCRTVVNITGDATAAVMVAATEGERPALRTS